MTTTIFCRFQKGDSVSYGIVDDQTVRAIEGDPFYGHRLLSEKHALADVKLLVPVMPGTFYAIGSNYKDHVESMARRRGKPPLFYDRPRVGYRANSSLNATEGDIVKPHDAGERFQYEGELVAVIGKGGRRLTMEQSAEAIMGWTIGNDMSERDWQASDATNIRAKNCDTFNPMGPWIVTGLDIRDMTTNVRVNGKLLHSFPTGNMLFKPEDVVYEIAKYNTLSPGDVVWLGTDQTPENVVPGDLIEIEITGIGTLRNRVVGEKAPEVAA